MLIQDFSYPLPDERIAKYPLSERDASKLLLYSDGEVREDVFRNLPKYLPEGALIVMNNTRVIRARLRFRKDTGARIEIFLLEPLAPRDYQQNFAATGSCSWVCLIGNAKKWKTGTVCLTLNVNGRPVTLTAERENLDFSLKNGEQCVRFRWQSSFNSSIKEDKLQASVTASPFQGTAFSEILEACGELPIPPYLNRDTEDSDLQTYQTVYARIKGSVAAPTAGLHFTDRVFAELDARGIERQEVTLHVGAGTFRPVKTDEVEQHEMHAEWICVSRGVVESLLRHDCRCIAVGTTSVRTLESLYYLGVMLHRQETPDFHALHVPQWMPYDSETNALTTEEALQALLSAMDRVGEDTLRATTQIMIKPGYQYHIVRTMVTNFHQPQSTLLLLVSAFLNGDWRKVYDYALAHDFRFLSYGDSCLLNY